MLPHCRVKDPGSAIFQPCQAATRRLDLLADPPHRGALKADGTLGTDQLQ